MAKPLVAQFEEYRSWYAESYVPAWEEQRGEPVDQRDPLAELTRVKPSEANKLEARCGALPVEYVNLLTTLGAGRLWLAAKEEPMAHELLAPKAIAAAQKDLASWLSKAAVTRAKSKQKLDVAKLVPFLSLQGTWAVLAAQTPSDNRVYLVSHEWEQREDLDLFAGPLTLGVFFERYFGQARDKDPLNGSTAHRAALLKGR